MSFKKNVGSNRSGERTRVSEARINLIEDLAKETSVEEACKAMGMSKATLYQRRKNEVKIPKVRKPGTGLFRALTEVKKNKVLDLDKFTTNNWIKATIYVVYERCIEFYKSMER